MPQEQVVPVVIGLGEVLWDMLPAGKQLGGAPANFAYHARQLGAEAHVVSSVGRDALGAELLAQLDRLGLRRDFVAVDPAHATGVVTVALNQRGEPSYVIHEKVAWDYLPVAAGLVDLAARADAVCFGTLAQRGPVSRESILAVLAATRKGCLRIFDINLRQHYYTAAVIRQGLEAADVLKLNDAELPAVAQVLDLHGDTDELLCALLANFQLQAIALTRGEHGAVLTSAGQRSQQAGLAVRVVDSVGAGDAFTAMLAMGLIRHLDLDTINRLACRLASFVCGQPGATPAVPPEFLQE